MPWAFWLAWLASGRIWNSWRNDREREALAVAQHRIQHQRSDDEDLHDDGREDCATPHFARVLFFLRAAFQETIPQGNQAFFGDTCSLGSHHTPP
jgi:hypothetical protein